MSSTREQSSAVRGRLPVAPRDKRPALAALALLLILVGALGSALLVFRSGDRENVLAARDDIAFGQTITRDDFKTVRAAADAEGVFDAGAIGRLVGAHAITTIPAGTLINGRMFAPKGKDVIPPNGENVGIVIDATQRPSSVPRAGDVVKLYYVSGSQGFSKSAPDFPVIVPAARVVGVGSGSGAGTKSITVLVRSSVAAKVADYASSGNIAVTVLPQGTKPTIDIEK